MSPGRRIHQNWMTNAFRRRRRDGIEESAAVARRHASAAGRGARISLVTGRRATSARRKPAFASRTGASSQGLGSPAARWRLRIAARVGFREMDTVVPPRHKEPIKDRMVKVAAGMGQASVAPQ